MERLLPPEIEISERASSRKSGGPAFIIANQLGSRKEVGRMGLDRGI